MRFFFFFFLFAFKCNFVNVIELNKWHAAMKFLIILFFYDLFCMLFTINYNITMKTSMYSTILFLIVSNFMIKLH